jgi:hypothetical protein
MRVIRNSYRLLAVLMLAGGLSGPLFAQGHKVCSTDPPDCDCCQEASCPERHSNMCPSDHHDCVHHTGTDCEWSDIE